MSNQGYCESLAERSKCQKNEISMWSYIRRDGPSKVPEHSAQSKSLIANQMPSIERVKLLKIKGPN